MAAGRGAVLRIIFCRVMFSTRCVRNHGSDLLTTFQNDVRSVPPRSTQNLKRWQKLPLIMPYPMQRFPTMGCPFHQFARKKATGLPHSAAGFTRWFPGSGSPACSLKSIAGPVFSIVSPIIAPENRQKMKRRLWQRSWPMRLMQELSEWHRVHVA